jgi:hypothetical protein
MGTIIAYNFFPTKFLFEITPGLETLQILSHVEINLYTLNVASPGTAKRGLPTSLALSTMTSRAP